MTVSREKLESLLTELASAVKAERKARKENHHQSIQQDWEQSLDNRLEALALAVLCDVDPSAYTDTRDQQVKQTNLPPLFRAGGTY